MTDLLRTRTLLTLDIGSVRVSLEWKLADLWIGAFFARHRAGWEGWICLVPCLPIHVEPRPISGREFLAGIDAALEADPNAFAGLLDLVEMQGEDALDRERAEHIAAGRCPDCGGCGGCAPASHSAGLEVRPQDRS